MTVTWSVAGLPPAYVERRWRAGVPDSLRAPLNDFLARTRFFELPADLGGNAPDGRDMGTYSITIADGFRTHTVRFSDSTQTNDLAAFRAWIVQNLGPTAAVEP